MAEYVVGDIQGCFEALERLLDSVGFNPRNDQLIAVGDLIGRGPQALETIEYLYSLGDNFRTVLGNHDLHFLAVYSGIRKLKTKDKFDALLASPNITKYIDWLRHKPLALALDEHTLISHAGLYPQWSIKQGLALSQEVSDSLQGKDWQKILKKMYGDQPNVWDETLSGSSRWRFIVNAFTRMRYMLAPDKLEFNCKDSPYLAPSTLYPWFNIENVNLSSQDSVLFGHWATLAGQTYHPQFIALDTGYVWQQELTMWQRQNGKKYSVSYQD
jgi:bis(5'-nucleosyl)-tetraphosphatase (symmetrical)